jgi:hypothetical protein
MLLMALDLVQRGEQRPGLGGAMSRHQPQHAAAAPLRGLEAEDRLDGAPSGARYLPRRGALRVEPEHGRRRANPQGADDGLRAVDGADRPGQRHDVAPIGLRVKQGRECGIVLPARALETREPVLRVGLLGFCPRQHHARLPPLTGM